jgi:hypothetical protein
VFLPAGVVLGLVTGATLGGVIAANRLHRDRVALLPVGPDVPGLTFVEVF